MNIEDVISLRAVEEMQSRLRERLDPRSWTVDNRDQELDAIRNAAMDIVEDSTPITLRILAQEIDGKPFIYWNLVMQVLGHLIDTLNQARQDLDYLTPEERGELAVDEQWLTNQLRTTLVGYRIAQDNVDGLLNSFRNQSMVDSEEI